MKKKNIFPQAMGACLRVGKRERKMDEANEGTNERPAKKTSSRRCAICIFNPKTTIFTCLLAVDSAKYRNRKKTTTSRRPAPWKNIK